jgi:hypothetical protein
LQRLEKEAFENKEELLSEVPAACQRLWTSAEHIKGREFCSILNEAIRLDDPIVSSTVAALARAINCLSIMRGKSVDVEWPGDFKLYRGGGLPVEHQSFFSVGKEYRVPMYLATSTDRGVCLRTFCYRAHSATNHPPVLFTVLIDPAARCVHVNGIKRTNCPDESEFLFVPYSVFQVVGVNWKEKPTWMDPHEVIIKAAPDNQLCSEDLPLSPWH